MENNIKNNTYDKEKATKKFRIFEKFVLGLEMLMIVGIVLVGITAIGVGMTITENADVNQQELSGEQYVVFEELSGELI